ncbi:MAG: hypothetical protein AAF799_11345 [Myxococcota bacterium]
MTISKLSFRPLVGAVGLCLLSTACIINTTDDDDGSLEATDDGTPPATGEQTPGTTGGDPDTDGNDDDTDPTTGGPVGDCGDNIIIDPGFEAGTPNNDWDEVSDVFGTPICDSTCTDEEGAEPYMGEHWVWLGGVEDEPEMASVTQRVTIEPDTAFLSFWFQIRSGAGTGDDMFTVSLDGDALFMVTDMDMPEYSDYTQVDIDVTPWADGGTYELSFASDHAGTGLTSFFVDEVSLVSCSETMDTGDSGSETVGQDETAGDSTGDTGGTTGGESSSGTDGGSSTGEADAGE